MSTGGTAPVEAAVKRAVGHASFSGMFKHPVKFNGTDFVETRLSADEQLAEVTKIALNKLHVFLERYGTLLSDDDLQAITTTSLANTAEARFWLERLQRAPPTAATKQKKGRRRRWLWAKREMGLPDGYFSEESMKHRDPKLFHELIGRHLEPSTRLSAPMQGSLSSYLMQRLEQDIDAPGDSACDKVDGSNSAAPVGDSGTGATVVAATAGKSLAGDGSRDVAAKRIRKNDIEPDAMQGDSGDDMCEDTDMSDGEGAVMALGDDPDADDVTLRRAKYLKKMRDRFVNGSETGFDYAAIDDDSDLDDIVELGRDAEEQYFDNEAAIDADGFDDEDL